MIFLVEIIKLLLSSKNTYFKSGTLKLPVSCLQKTERETCDFGRNTQRNLCASSGAKPGW